MAAEKWPDRESVVFLQDGIRKTFSQFHEEVDNLAAGLLALGLERGHRLGLWGPNTYEWILFQFATAKAGIIMVSLNPAYQSKELEFALRKVQCKAVVCPTQYNGHRFCDILRQICPKLSSTDSGPIMSSRLPDLRMIIVMDSRLPGTLHVDSVVQAAESRHHEQLESLQRVLSPDDPIMIQFTSGTTGSPKGVTMSHHNIVNNSYFVGLRLGYNRRQNVRVCVSVPVHHSFVSVLGAVCMAVHGITLVFPSTTYDVRANLEAIQRERCTAVYGNPTMYIDLLAHPDLKNYDLSSVELGLMGGSPCPSEVIKKILYSTGIEAIMVLYGATETSPITFMEFEGQEMRKEGVGCVMQHTEAKVVEPTSGNLLPLGHSGELMIRGYCVMLGYWNDPEKTLESISEAGWYKTGDVARMDEYGYCRIEGRIKEVIMRWGDKIIPLEVEEFLYTHPKVKEVHVVGVCDVRLGQQVCACIKLVEGQKSSSEEIRDFCKGQMSDFKIPHYVVFVESFPRTASGKVQKSALRVEMEMRLGL